MIEIYLEKLYDLMIAPKNRKIILAVKQSKTAIYVAGAKQIPVTTQDGIQAAIDMGESHKTVAATLMNATSSRAHTVITVQITKATKTGAATSRMVSTINIVDLAGSEKSDSAGTTGDRLAEGNAINKSLSCLGNVITALGKKSMGTAAKGAVIPYRESQLTRML